LLDRASQQLSFTSPSTGQYLRIRATCIAPFAYSFPLSLLNRSCWIARAASTRSRIAADGSPWGRPSSSSC
jgi:hypothetical protein